MPESDEYKTLESTSKGIYREKASKFIALAIPVTTEEEATSSLAKIRKEYFDANHHCYAFRIGVEGREYRYSDDREPSGTAGRPIYGEILSAGLTNILIVVIRYFGGTKLGTSGLIRAYKSAAKDAIHNGNIITRYNEQMVKIEFDYGVTSEVMRIIKEEELKIVSQSFEQFCELRILVRETVVARVVQRFQPLCTIQKVDFQ